MLKPVIEYHHFCTKPLNSYLCCSNPPLTNNDDSLRKLSRHLNRLITTLTRINKHRSPIRNDYYSLRRTLVTAANYRHSFSLGKTSSNDIFHKGSFSRPTHSHVAN
jgi:hypothetical protein